MILHGYWRSSASYRVRIALNWKGIAADDQAVDVRAGAQRAPDYLALNPQGLVPALVDGPVVLSQSLAIIEYLEEIRPDPPLLPDSPADRARVRAAALAIACDIHPLNNPRIMNYLRAEMGQPQDAIDAWIKHWIAVGFGPLEATAGARYLCGDAVTMADLCLVPQMYNARRLDTPLDSFPRLVEIDSRLTAIEAVAAAHPDRFKPAD